MRPRSLAVTLRGLGVALRAKMTKRQRLHGEVVKERLIVGDSGIEKGLAVDGR